MSSRLRVVAERGVQAWDLTPRAEDLRFSSVNPGGDEVASFTLRETWRRGRPELARGNTLRVLDGIDQLWFGRIEEADRGADGVEETAVTAYGSGARLKDGSITRLYVSRAAERWEPPTLAMRIAVGTAGFPLDSAITAAADQQALRFDSEEGNVIVQGARSILMFDAGDERVAAFAYRGSQAQTGPMETATLYTGDDDSQINLSESDALNLDDTVQIQAVDSPARYAMLRMRRLSASGNGTGSRRTFRLFAVYGETGLERQPNGEETPGFLVSQMVADVVADAPNVQARRIDPTTFVIDDAVFDEPQTHEELISALNEFERADWGCWGADSVLDRGDVANFEYRKRDRLTRHWFTRRADCESLDLHSELAGMFTRLIVSYSDETDTPRTLEQRASVPELDGAGLEITATFSAGKLTRAKAQAFASTMVALQAGFSPARGSVTLRRPVRHFRRGILPAHYMRADGANLAIPDAVESERLFALSGDADRRSTFPILRVEVSAGVEGIETVLSLDQAADDLSSLQSRLELAGQFAAPETRRRRVGRRGRR